LMPATRSDAAAPRRIVMLGVVFLVPVVYAFAGINDLDIWWHLRTGEWIVTHRALPWTDPFSVAGGAWVAYTWLFELVAFASHATFGLMGIVLMPAVLSLAILASL